MYGARRISNTSRTIYDLWEDVFSLRDVTWRCQVWTWRLIRDRSDLLTSRWLLRRRLRSFCGVRTHTHTHTHICTKKNRMKDVAWQFIYGSRRMTVTSCTSSLFLWGPHTHTHTCTHICWGRSTNGLRNIHMTDWTSSLFVWDPNPRLVLVAWNPANRHGLGSLSRDFKCWS